MHSYLLTHDLVSRQVSTSQNPWLAHVKENQETIFSHSILEAFRLDTTSLKRSEAIPDRASRAGCEPTHLQCCLCYRGICKGDGGWGRW